MEFTIFRPKNKVNRYLTPLILPAFFMSIWLVLVILVPDIEREDMIILSYAFGGLSFLLAAVIYISVFTYSGDRYRITLKEEGMLFNGPKKEIEMKWSDVGLIYLGLAGQIRMIYIFERSLTKQQCSEYTMNGLNIKKIDGKFLYVEYYPEFYRELKKYYEKEIIGEYKLALEGKYEN
ncbi:MAG: hypothetical protein JXN65_03585 [Clostridia bacterium]|nr:hypothetical protein [Clostridia bacterium]